MAVSRAKGLALFGAHLRVVPFKVPLRALQGSFKRSLSGSFKGSFEGCVVRFLLWAPLRDPLGGTWEP